MNVITADLPESMEMMELHAFSDLHIGDNLCDFRKIQEAINYVAETPNAYCILNGDLMDTAIASSVGDTYGANLQPMEQLDVCVKLFEPIKGKVICILPGNHENRVYKYDGLDITKIMAAQLGLQDKYSSTSAYLVIRFGRNGDSGHHGRKMVYTVYCRHGSGGGKKEGGKINALADMAQICDADIYICGHTHLPASFRTQFFRPSLANNSLTEIEKLYVNTAASLKFGGYGEVAGFKPASTINPVIYLSGTKKWARALV